MISTGLYVLSALENLRTHRCYTVNPREREPAILLWPLASALSLRALLQVLRGTSVGPEERKLL